MLCSKEQAFTFSITKLKKWVFHNINHNPCPVSISVKYVEFRKTIN